MANTQTLISLERAERVLQNTLRVDMLKERALAYPEYQTDWSQGVSVTDSGTLIIQDAAIASLGYGSLNMNSDKLRAGPGEQTCSIVELPRNRHLLIPHHPTQSWGGHRANGVDLVTSEELYLDPVGREHIIKFMTLDRYAIHGSMYGRKSEKRLYYPEKGVMVHPEKPVICHCGLHATSIDDAELWSSASGLFETVTISGNVTVGPNKLTAQVMQFSGNERLYLSNRKVIFQSDLLGERQVPQMRHLLRGVDTKVIAGFAATIAPYYMDALCTRSSIGTNKSWAYGRIDRAVAQQINDNMASFFDAVLVSRLLRGDTLSPMAKLVWNQVESAYERNAPDHVEMQDVRFTEFVNSFKAVESLRD